MCLTVNSSKVPTKSRWGYKAMSYHAGFFYSNMGFKWTPGYPAHAERQSK